MKITVKSVNVETGEETIFEREETVEETAQRIVDENAYKEFVAQAEAKAQAKAALLERLGITQDEANLLLS